jgi:hypothetical protein
MQSYLEKQGIEARKIEIARKHYDANNEYGTSHKDSLSDGDEKGKGTGHGGHTHFLPNHNKPKTTIDYSNFDTTKGGNIYDINGRNDIGGRKKALAYSLYNSENQYGIHLIDTELNLKDGQYQVK